ncbi:MAG: M14 family zinc carboxypeptidase [Anaerolineaceae bacterium]
MTFTSASNSSEELLQIARNAVVSGHRATAARMVNRVLETDPSNKNAWRLLAECLSDPESKRKCLVKAGDLTAHIEKTNYTTERYTVAPANRIELPPPHPAEETDPVILPPRKYKPSSRAEYPAGKSRSGNKSEIRTARTRKNDPAHSSKHKSNGGWGFLLFLLLAAGLVGAYFYLKPDISLDGISDLLFPSSQSADQVDAAVDDLVPPEELSQITETPTEVPDPNQPQENADSDLDTSVLVEKVIPVGESVGGRPIEVYQFGSGETQRLIVAGMHGGNEYNTIDLADELIEYIRANPQVIPPEKTLFILRNLNPDGEARGHNFDGRTNENGVDLNRNWDSHWKIDWNRDNCWVYRPVTGGPFPTSEPETQALLTFINNNHIDAIINYHSAALGIFPGGQPYEVASISLSEILAEATGYSYPPVNIGCEYTGMFTDWAADHGIPAVDVELTNHRDTDFDQNLKAMNVLLAWDPNSSPKSLPGAKPGEPGYIKETRTEETIFFQAQDSAETFFKDIYGIFMSNFEER